MPYTLTQLQELEVDGRNRFSGAEQFVPVQDIVRAPNVSNRQYNIRDYGAVGDGVADDTAAFLAACAAVEVTGGDLVIPPGKYLIKQGYNFTLGTNGTNKAVWIRGGGNHNTMLLFQPTTLSDNCIGFGNGVSYYYGGGIQDLQISCVPQTGTGAGINIYMTIHTEIRDTYVLGFQGTNGTGLKVRQNGSSNVQHLYLSNVYCQQNYLGADMECGAACVATNFKLNQNTNQAAKISKGDMLWNGGLVQGVTASPAVTIGYASPGTSNITIQNVYCEYGTASYVWDVLNTNFVAIRNCPWAVPGTPQTFVRATTSGSLEIDQINLPGGGGHKFVESISSTGRVRAGNPATDYTIDASSSWDFIASGQYPTTLRATAPAATATTALALGGPFKPAQYTTAARDALASPQEGWIIWNTTTHTLQRHNGTNWGDV